MKAAALPSTGCVAVAGAGASGLSLRANFAWSLAGNLVYAGSQWCMLVVIAKLGTGEMVGQFALALSLTAPVMMFAQLQLRTLQATDARQEFQFVHYLGLRTLCVAAALLASGAIVTLGGYRAETSFVVLAVAAFKAVELFCDIFYGRLQRRETMDRIGVSLAVRGLLSLAVLAAALRLGAGLAWAALGLAGAWTVVLLAWDSRPTGPELGWKQVGAQLRTVLQHDRALLGRLLRVAWPLGLVSMLNSLSSAWPRFMLERGHGERELGAFAAAASLMLVGQQVVAALSQAVSPRLAELYACGNGTGFRRLLSNLLWFAAAIGVGGCLLVWLYGAELLALCFRREYSAYALELQWLMIAATLYYLCFFLNCAMSAARYLVVQLPLLSSVCLTAGVAGWLWIPRYGAAGAAWSVLAAATCQLVLSSLITGHLLRGLPAKSPRGDVAGRQFIVGGDASICGGESS